jgi:hypothetical protein
MKVQFGPGSAVGGSPDAFVENGQRRHFIKPAN